MSTESRKPVLILGAGINGCAVARELLLNGIPVCIVEAHDIAWGATSRSSRLIHGGLRYLEYGDFRLVRESLQERTRLRTLAPQFVHPLRLYIPVRRRFAGLYQSAFRFFGGDRISKTPWLAALVPKRTERGLWLVRLGLWFYDRFAWGREFPKYNVVRSISADGPSVAAEYRWLCGYTDAQMRYPERFILALLEDARRLAAQNSVEFSVFTYHRAVLDGPHARIERRSDGSVSASIAPSLVINSTGAWGDRTLAELHVSSPPLFGGTKGSHLVTFDPGLRAALGGDAVYAETSDGRLVFVLPFGDSVLVGTTDERFSGSPDNAVATELELDYLIGMINHLFPQLPFTRNMVHVHYAGVRPLPASVAGKTASISRDHFIETNHRGPVGVWTLVGGKLTTSRALAELVAQQVCSHLVRDHRATSRERIIPGGEDYPADDAAVASECACLAEQHGLSLQSTQAMWELCGSRVHEFLDSTSHDVSELLPGTALPVAFVRWVIENEWVQQLGDLVERRLMLLYSETLSEQTLRRLAICLVEAGLLQPSEIDSAVGSEIHRLREFYGKLVRA